jgi:hypothetical protein
MRGKKHASLSIAPYREVRFWHFCDRPSRENEGRFHAENAATDIAIAITKIIERHRTVRRKVERLAEALRKPEERDEAADAIRALIEKITLTPARRARAGSAPCRAGQPQA